MEKAKRWVDDMLDLYLAAKRLGDDTWAESIMDTLKVGYEASKQTEQAREESMREKRMLEIDTRLTKLQNFRAGKPAPLGVG